MHVLTQTTVLEENQKTYVHNEIVFWGERKKNQAYRITTGDQRVKHRGKKLESFFQVGHTSRTIKIYWSRESPSLYPTLPVMLLSTLSWALY